MKKKILLIMLTLIFACSLLPNINVSASDDIIEGRYIIYTENNNKNCLFTESVKNNVGKPVPISEEGIKVITATPMGTTDYLFDIKRVGDKYQIKFVATDKLLTAQKNGLPVILKSDNGSKEQLFDIIKHKSGNVNFVAYDGSYLDISGNSTKAGADILLWKSTGNSNQRFILKTLTTNQAIPKDQQPEGLKSDALTLTTYPSKTLYEVGEELDLTGITIYSKYGGVVHLLTLQDVTLTVDGVNLYNGYKFTMAGTKEIKLKYDKNGRTGTLVLNVIPKGTRYANAVSSTANLVVDGKVVTVDAYKINDSNYFKLRDVAALLNGGKNNFDVAYNANTNSMTLYPQQKYNLVGGELSVGGAIATVAERSATIVYDNDNLVSVSGYMINGNNYFPIRQLARVVDFGLGWDGAKNVISLNSNGYYTGENTLETFLTSRILMVRGLSLGKTTVEDMKSLYGEPTEVIDEGILYTKGEATDTALGTLKYYVYTQDYKQLMIAYVLNNKVIGVYSNRDEAITSYSNVRKYKDTIEGKVYATLILRTPSYSYVSNENWAAQEKLCYYTTNALRATKNLTPFVFSKQATNSAENYAKLMAKTKHYSHTGPDGSTAISRMSAAGISSTIYAENICLVTTDYEESIHTPGFDMTNMWFNSSGHRQNMLSAVSRNLGVGMGHRFDDLNGEDECTVYGVQNFH